MDINEDDKYLDAEIVNLYINTVIDLSLNELLDDKETQHIILIICYFLFVNDVNKLNSEELNSEAIRVHNYIIEYLENGTTVTYIKNKNITESSYIILVSVIETLQREGSFLFIFDQIITKNIKRHNKDILNAPVIKDVLPYLIPIFDSFNMYELFHSKLEK